MHTLVTLLLLICSLSICKSMEGPEEPTSFYHLPSEITQEILLNLIPNSITESSQLIELIRNFHCVGATEKYLNVTLNDPAFCTIIADHLENRLQSPIIIQEALSKLKEKKAISPFIKLLSTVQNSLTREIEALKEAIATKNTNATKLILEKVNANVLINDMPALMYALKKPSSPEIITTLLEYGANPNGIIPNKDVKDGIPALFLVIFIPLFLKPLMAYGAHVNQRFDNITPLLYACSNPAPPDLVANQLESIKILLDHGANKSEKNNKGFTALELAQATNNQAVVDLLLQHQDKLK